MRVILEILGGPFGGRKIVLRPPMVMQVGRTEDADYALPHDGQMSRVHFELQCDNQVCRINDLESRNGTFVNGEKVTEAILSNDDAITAGQTHFAVRIEPAARDDALAGSGEKPEEDEMASAGDRATHVDPQVLDDALSRATSDDRTASEQPPATAHHEQATPSPANQLEPGGSSLQLDRVVLEIQSGASRGQKIWLRPGQTITVGRTEQAEFALPDDGMLSGIHFSLECDPASCRLRDLDSANGTQLNGEPVIESVISDGDQVVAGQTTFIVHVATHPGPPAEPSTRLPSAAANTALAASATQSTRLSAIAPGPQIAIDSPRPYQAALEDEDPDVRREALQAAAWTGQTWLLQYCRTVSADPAPEHWDAIYLLAVLGKPSDLERIHSAAKSEPLGPQRFAILGAFGHPRVVPILLQAIASDDPRAAVAAAAAFTKITGVDIESDQRVQLPPEDDSEPDEFEQEFLDEVMLPDPKRAQEHWNKVKDQFAQGTRWCRGFGLSDGVSEEILNQLDMQSRWEACLRGKFEGDWQGSPIDLEVFPQDRGSELRKNRVSRGREGL